MRVGGVLLALAATACVAPPPPAIAEPAPSRPTSTTPLAPADPAAPIPPSGMQWFYGSGEGAAASLGLFNTMGALIAERVRKRPADSVILANPARSKSTLVPCGKKPFAIILDVDETALQNSGYEYQLAVRGKSSDSALLDKWQAAPRTAAVALPGAVEMVARARALGVTPVFVSNRDAPEASHSTAATLALAGYPQPVPGETLLLRGDVDGKPGKDGRRAFVASRYCVIAMAGDTLGDFSDAFNDKRLDVRQRRLLAQRMGGLWGHGWFMVSNPVYGAQLRGNVEEVFAPDERWNGE